MRGGVVADTERAGRDGRGNGERGEERRSRSREEWVQEAVRLLDMAVIMAGAPGREDMIGSLLGALQGFIEELDDDAEEGPPRKKRRVEEDDDDDRFPTEEGGRIYRRYRGE